MAGTAAVVFAAHGVYLRLLGYRTYGIWLLLATVNTFAQIGNVGVSQAVTKLVAEAFGSGNKSEAQAYQTTASALMMATGAIALAVTVLLRPWLAGWLELTGDDRMHFERLLVPIGAFSAYVLLVQSTAGALAGTGRMDLANYAQLAGRVVSFAVSVSLLMRRHGLLGLFIGQLTGNVLLHAWATVGLRSAGLGAFRLGDVTESAARRLLGIGSAVFGGSIVNMLLNPMNKFLIARGVGPQAVPVYEIAFSVSMQIRAVTDNAIRAIMPEVSRLSSAGAAGAASISDLLRKATRRSLAAGFLLHLAAFAVTDIALRLWLHNVPPFQALALRVMLVASWISIVGVPAYQALLGTEHMRECFFAYVVCVFANGVVAVCVLMFSPGSVLFYIVAAAIGLVAGHAYLWFVATRIFPVQRRAESLTG